jgi:uncharacterized protein (TIGR01777 family)
MKILMTGGTGFIGGFIALKLSELGHEVSIITRSASGKASDAGGIGLIEANPAIPGAWQESVPQFDVIINLAGASIFTIWTAKARREILESRVLTTRNIVNALSAARKGTLLISASAVGFYGGRGGDEILDESSPPGDDFLAKVAIEWEAEAGRAEEYGVRVALARFGIVMGRNGGALGMMVPAFKKYLGGPLGSGKQWFPWIHQFDLFEIMRFLIQREDLSGPVNCTAPNPVQNRDMARILAQVLNRPAFMPAVPAFVVKTMLGEFGSVLLEGQRALPRQLLDRQFQFRFQTIQEALVDLLG